MTTITTLAPSLAAHPGPYPGGYGFGWFPFFPLFGFFLLILFLFLVLGVLGRRRWGWGGPAHRDPVRSAEADLARRFAAGDIDEKEYEQRLATLRRLGAG